MKITRFFATGYKNLRECDVQPNGFHVVTGCNGTGKSNFIEVLSFLKVIINGSEEDRDKAFFGFGINYTQWIPMSEDNDVEPAFQVEGEIELEDGVWEFNYYLQLSKPVMESAYSLEKKLRIEIEYFKVKEKGKPGSMRRILVRDESGKCVAKMEIEGRISEKFKVVDDMSALSSLKIREASDFNVRFPVTSAFLDLVNNSRIVSLNPRDLVSNNRYYARRARVPNAGVGKFILSSIDLYQSLEDIQKDEFQWVQLNYWARQILRISKITLKVAQTELDDGESVNQLGLFLTQDGKVLWPHELSNGSIIILALLCVLLSPRVKGRILFIEEPEAYIHPKAIVDLVSLMKEVADEGNTIIASTHSPVVLNSLNSNQVTLLSFDGGSMAHSSLVSNIKEATDALARGIISFGDLLQNDFKP